MYLTDQNDCQLLSELILSKKLFRNQGKAGQGHCAEFETLFSQRMRINHSLLVSSGTNALICAFKSLNLQQGDEVIVPCYSYFGIVAAIYQSGGTPVIVNIDETLMIDCQEVIKKINNHTKAIVAVHMDGNACDLNTLYSICSVRKIALIEDVAQACGGEYKSKPLGSFGTFGCFSFNVDKIISCGEGGAILTNDRTIYEKCLLYQDASCLFGPTFKDEIKSVTPFIGNSMRVSEISGLLMKTQLDKLDHILFELKLRHSIIKKIFLENNIEIIPANDEGGSCGTATMIQLKDPDQVMKLFQHCANENIFLKPTPFRYAHTSWQWSSVFKNHYDFLNLKNSEYLFSIDLLSRTIKYPTPFEASIEETQSLAWQIVKTIKEYK